MIRITREQLTAMDPCYPERRLALFGRRKYLTVAHALDAGVSIGDILWVAGGLRRKDLCVRFALACAQRVAHLNPDPRVQAALDATQAWLDKPTYAAANAAGYAGDAARDAARYAAGDAGYAARAAGDAGAAGAAEAAAGYARYAAARAAGYAARAAGYAARAAAEELAQRELAREIFK